MNLPQLSIRRPIAISMVFFIFLLLGVFALFRLPVELRPNMEVGNVTIEMQIRGGVSPQEVEDVVARTLEDAFTVINGLEDIITISEEGECRVILYFKPEINLDYAVVEVRERYAQVQHKLPKEIERPVIAKYEYSQAPVVILGVFSKIRSVEELRRIAEDKIKNRFSRIEGVAKIEIGGGREEKIFVEINEVALRAHGFTIDDITRTLNANNLNLVAGNVEKGGNSTYLVRTVGQFQTLDDIRSLPIISTNEQDSHFVRISDVAEVGVSYLDPQALARVNSQPSISLYVQKSSEANTIKVVEEVEKTSEQLHKELPPDISIQPYFNHASYIKQAVSTVTIALYIGALLSVLVLWIFLRNLMYTLIISLTIPFSVITSFSLMYLSKISINVVTLSGIALGIGMLVDSSIVVLENIFKKRESFEPAQGGFAPETLKATAEQGADEVFIAIIASTLTTVAVFVPLFFVNKEIQRLYSGLALTVVFALITSLFFSFTLVPLLASRTGIRVKKKERVAKEKEKDGRKKFDFYKLREFFDKAIDFVMVKRYFFIVATVGLLVIALVQIASLGRDFIGIAEQNRFTVYVQMPSGTKIEVSDRIVKDVEKILDGIPEIKEHTSRVMGWSSQIYVELKSQASMRTVDEVIEEIRIKTQKMEPAFIYSQQSESVGSKEIMVEVFGHDYEALKDLANQVGGAMKGTGKFKEVKLRMRSGRPEIHIIFDKNKLALQGLTTLDVSNTIHAKMRGLIATRFHTVYSGDIMLRTNVLQTGSRIPSFEEYGRKAFHQDLNKISRTFSRDYDLGEGQSREIETITRLEKSFRDTLDDIYNLSLRSKDNSLIFLHQVAQIKGGLGPAEIWRKNKERMVQVSAEMSGIALSEAADTVDKALESVRFPKDYHYRFGGDYDKMIRNQGELTQAVLLALFLVYLVLASVFESFTQPFIVLTTIPMAMIGVGFGLRFAGEPIGLGVYVGIVVLVGIVVNNAIILIDYVNRLRRVGAYKDLPGKSLPGFSAVKIAVLWRLRPILMTSLTTILTMIPLIFDRGGTSSLWRPLAITIVGGMVTSTLLTFFIIPAVYLIAEDIGKVRPFRFFD